MALAWIQMQFGRNPHAPELPVNQRGAVRGIWILPAMVQAHRAGLLVELEGITDLDISTVTVPEGRGTGLSVGRDIGGSVDYRPIDMTRDLIKLVDRLIGGGLGTCGKH